MLKDLKRDFLKDLKGDFLKGEVMKDLKKHFLLKGHTCPVHQPDFVHVDAISTTTTPSGNHRLLRVYVDATSTSTTQANGNRPPLSPKPLKSRDPDAIWR